MNTLTSPSPLQATATVFAPERPVLVVDVKSPAPKRRLPWRKIITGASMALIVGGGIAGYLRHAAGFETTDDAFLAGDVHPVSPRINGTVVRVLVEDNAHVAAGQPLVEIDPADLTLALQGAEAELAQARANAAEVAARIVQAHSEVDAATARIAQNAAQLKRAELDFHRMEILASDSVRAVSTQVLDNAREAFDAAQADRQSLIAERAAAEAGLAGAEAQQAIALAQIQKAEAAVNTAKLQVDYTVIRAPSTGRIAKKSVEAGQRLQPGQPVMAVVDDGLWVVANFKENQLARLRVGQPVKIKIDALDDRVFPGTVQSFSPGTGAAFSLLPPDNATGNFTKIVQRVPVKILFSPGSVGADATRLAPGLSAVVRVGLTK